MKLGVPLRARSSFIRSLVLVAAGTGLVALPFAGCALEPWGTGEGLSGSTSTGTTTSTGMGGGMATSTSNTGTGGGMGGAGGGIGGAGGGTTGSGGGPVCGGNGGLDPCAPWWKAPAYARRVPIEIDAQASTEDLKNFPWLIRLDATKIDYTKAQPDADDVRFVAEDNTTELPRDIEQWNESGTSAIWVKIPSIPAGGKVRFWMYYDNQTTMGPDPKQAWDGSFVSVHHLHLDLKDATGGHDATSDNAPLVAQSGKIANARFFNGTGHYLELPKEADYDFTSTLTVSAWINVLDWNKDWQAIVTKGDSTWRLHRDSDTLPDSNNLALGFATNSNNFGGKTSVENNGWHHVAAVFDLPGAKKYIYVDGVEDASENYGAMLTKNNFAVAIGENLEATGRFFQGYIDEVRISSNVRSASWLKIESMNVNNPNLTTFGSEQFQQ